MKNKKLIEIKIEESVYKTYPNKMFENRKKWEVPNPNHVLSYIPGTIIKVNVTKGETIKQGEELLILEAMKMQNRITMPFLGKIKSVNIKEGQRIPKSYIMIEIE